MEMKPPCDMPTKNAFSTPRCDSNASASSAESQYVKSPWRGLPPKPRSSQVMQRNSPASAATCDVEHVVVHQEPVAEDHGRAVAAGILEVDVLTVDVGE